MKPKTIKLLDYWIGIFLTSLLTFIRYFILFFHKYEKKTSQKILFIKLIEQGATILAIPSINRAIELVGAENVFFLVFSENRPVLDVIKIIPKENIIEIHQNNFIRFVIDTFKALYKTHKLRIDTNIDMEFFSRFTAVFSYLSGSKIRIGYHRYTSELPFRGNLMTHKIQYNPYLHIAKAYKMLVETVTMDAKTIPLTKSLISNITIELPKYIPNVNETEKIKNLIISLGINDIDSKRIILLNPNAGDMLPIRKWDNLNYILLAEKILEHYSDSIIIFTGNKFESQNVDLLCAKLHSERAISLAGRTSLGELITLYSLADILITNDSGPAHFASLTDINIITLFGPETPLLFSPLSKKAINLRVDLTCSPCVSVLNNRFSPCKDNVCMKTLSFDYVFDVIKKLIK